MVEVEFNIVRMQKKPVRRLPPQIDETSLVLLGQRLIKVEGPDYAPANKLFANWQAGMRLFEKSAVQRFNVEQAFGKQTLADRRALLLEGCPGFLKAIFGGAIIVRLNGNNSSSPKIKLQIYGKT